MSDSTQPSGPVDGSAQLTIDVAGSESMPVLLCRGEVDAATAPILREALESVDATEVTLDLGAVTFIDSAGIQVVASAMRRLQPLGGTVSVSAASRPVRRIFDIVGLGDLIAG